MLCHLGYYAGFSHQMHFKIMKITLEDHSVYIYIFITNIMESPSFGIKQSLLLILPQTKHVYIN